MGGTWLEAACKSALPLVPVRHHRAPVQVLADPAGQIELAMRVAKEGLSVRQVEACAQRLAQEGRPETAPKPVDPNVRAAVDELERHLGTRVKIVELTGQRGYIQVEYYSQAELDRLYQQIVS